MTQSHNVTIIRKDGTVYDFEALGIRLTDLKLSTPEYETQYEQVGNRMIDVGTTLKGRKLSASFFVSATDSLDFPLMVDEIFVMLSSREAFYIIDGREPGKRMLVKAEPFEVTQLTGTTGTFDVTFTSASPYRESTGTTQGNFDFDAELWQIGQGLTEADDEYVYDFTTSNFSVYNAGDITVDPRFAYLKITFKGASTNLNITNTTTGDTWQYTGVTGVNDTVVLEGIRSTKNTVSIFGNTNRKVITVTPGANVFTVTGTSGSFTLEFDFRYLYI